MKKHEIAKVEKDAIVTEEQFPNTFREFQRGNPNALLGQLLPTQKHSSMKVNKSYKTPPI
jgi:hypothetical protein